MENFINNAPFIVVLLCLIVGFVFLVKGADLFVEAAQAWQSASRCRHLSLD